jgi:RNA polymerase sigma factor (sigma-70 family)
LERGRWLGAALKKNILISCNYMPGSASYIGTNNKPYTVSEAQFLDLVKQNQGIIYKLVALYAHDAEEKKDLYQEILLLAWKGWPGFRGESSFSTWLYRISINTIFTHKRKRKRVDYTDAMESLPAQVPHTSLQQEEALRLQQAIRQLSEIDRAVISFHLDGFGNPEIAEMLGISLNHVAVKLHRSKQQVANLLKR